MRLLSTPCSRASCATLASGRSQFDHPKFEVTGIDGTRFSSPVGSIFHEQNSFKLDGALSQRSWTGITGGSDLTLTTYFRFHQNVSAVVKEPYYGNVATGETAYTHSGHQGHHCGTPRPHSAELMMVLDGINNSGLGKVWFAGRGIAPEWLMKREMPSSAYTTRWKELPVARF